MPELRIFDSREEASIALANHISQLLENAIATRGTATCVVSGGSSPVTLFRRLRQRALPWQNVTLIPSDERLVAIDHSDSNEGMIRHELMREEAAPAMFLSLASDEKAGNCQLARTNRQLGKLDRPLDVVVLGMGEDGHTASLFPTSPDVAEALRSSDYCVIQKPAGFTVARLTLTPAILLQSRAIFLLFFGRSKRAIYDRAISGDSLEELPVRFLLQQHSTPVCTFWAG